MAVWNDRLQFPGSGLHAELSSQRQGLLLVFFGIAVAGLLPGFLRSCLGSPL